MESLIGPAAGIVAAILWAFSSVLYSRLPIRASTITTFKNMLSTVLMGCLLWGTSSWNGRAMWSAPVDAWWLLGLSGIVGLLLGDVAYFRSLQLLGPRKALALTLMTPATTALLGRIQLGEVLPLTVWSAIIVTLLGITIVMRERVADPITDEDPLATRIGRSQFRTGVLFAVVGVLCQTVGSVAMKMGASDISTIEATFIRLVVATVAAMGCAAVTAQWSDFRIMLTNRRELGRLSAAAFLGTFLGVWMMLISFKYCPVGVAATLTSTSPLFVLPVVRIFYGERINSASWVGALVAVSGVGWLLLFTPTAT